MKGAQAPGERGFRLEDIEQSLELNKRYIQKKFSKKLKLIRSLIDLESRLTGIYLNSILVKKRLGLVYHENVVVNNALLNLPHRSLSILFLTENILYGSARIIERQFFEHLVIAKFSEFDSAIVSKWTAKEEFGDRKNDISFGGDVMSKLRNKKDLSAIQKTWHELNNTTHPTKFAQQEIGLPMPVENKERELDKWRKATHLEADVHYTLDLLFMLLCMNFHLLNSNWGRKAYRWYLGYHKDDLGVWKREKRIKVEIRESVKLYFELNKKYRGINKMLKDVIRQYRQSWRISGSVVSQHKPRPAV